MHLHSHSFKQQHTSTDSKIHHVLRRGQSLARSRARSSSKQVSAILYSGSRADDNSFIAFNSQGRWTSEWSGRSQHDSGLEAFFNAEATTRRRWLACVDVEVDTSRIALIFAANRPITDAALQCRMQILVFPSLTQMQRREIYAKVLHNELPH